MTKKKPGKKQEDFFDVMPFGNDDYSDDMMVDVMGSMLEATNNQMTMALELTKLIVANSQVKDMEEYVFSIFKKAVKVVGENYPLKNIME